MTPWLLQWGKKDTSSDTYLFNTLQTPGLSPVIGCSRLFLLRTPPLGLTSHTLRPTVAFMHSCPQTVRQLCVPEGPH